MWIETTYIEPRRFCRGCRKKRAGKHFPDTEAEAYCNDCWGPGLAKVLGTINVRPSHARRR